MGPGPIGHHGSAVHGGGAPQVRAKAATRVAEARARQFVVENGWQPVRDPLSALADLVGECVAVKDELRSRVNELRALTAFDRAGREDVRAVLAAYERALDRVGRLLVDVARLDLEGRLATVEEAKAHVLAEAVLRVLGSVELGLAPDQVEQARSLVAHELRALSGKDTT